MNKYFLKIAYDGTRYSGWQIQKNGISIQALLQEALQTALRSSPLSLIGSGRTDAGVHALGQCAHFLFPSLDAYKTLGALNGLLPPDIRVLQLHEIASSFHAQHSALRKIYHYHLHLDPVMSPFKRLYSVHVRKNFSLSLLEEALSYFIGEHDFTSFANLRKDFQEKSHVRTIYQLDAMKEEGGVRLEFEGNGFLYKMVRNLVGTLLSVAAKKLSVKDIPRIFSLKNRKAAPGAAPPQGLFLVKVLYPEDLQTK